MLPLIVTPDQVPSPGSASRQPAQAAAQL